MSNSRQKQLNHAINLDFFQYILDNRGVPNSVKLVLMLESAHKEACFIRKSQVEFSKRHLGW